LAFHHQVFSDLKPLGSLETMMSTPVGVSMRPMEICSPCPRPCDQGPVYLQFLVKRNEEAFEKQVEAFTLGLDSVLQDFGRLPEANVHVVGVDSDETRFVLEVIIDGCQSQSSCAIFDTVEKLAEEEKDKLPAEKQAVESTVRSEPKLPHPWQQHVSSRTGKFYWYNPDTKETTWICPTPIVAPATSAYQRDAMNRVLVEDGLARKVMSKMDRIRGKNPGAKHLDLILVGDSHHPLCMDAKKAVAVAVEKNSVDEAKSTELQAFETSMDYLSAQSQMETKQVEFCNAELGFRRAEESLALAKECSPQDRVELEKRANDEKSWWAPMLERAYQDLSEATDTFEALEVKRQSMTLEAATSAAAANFAQVKADKARQMVLELCGGAECSCFISYIQLEEYYASQVQDDQFGVNAQMDLNVSPAFPYNQYFASQVPMKSKKKVVEFTTSLAWLDAHQEGFFQLPETVTYIGMPKMTTNSTTTSTATRRVPETKDFSIYSTQEMSLYRTQEESAGFQKGNSVSIPIPSLLIAPAISTAMGGERAGLLQNC
jgi:hypothetical protein